MPVRGQDSSVLESVGLSYPVNSSDPCIVDKDMAEGAMGRAEGKEDIKYQQKSYKLL